MQRSIVTMNWWQLYLQPVLSVQHAAKLSVQGTPRHVCVWRVRGVCHSAATGNLVGVPERRPGICDLIRNVLGTVERRLC
jgi:hypothetical protein